MRKNIALNHLRALFWALSIATVATVRTGADTLAIASDKAITVKAIAEVETKISLNGHDAVKLEPAERVVPGDQVIYTLEIKNTGAFPIPAPSVLYPIPEHMRYIADSAVGPGAEVSYSIDGGRTFERPENLTVTGPQGVKRSATAAEYTHIRWQLKNNLNGNSIAYARFRAVVK
jgi:uncharacterized repeat protein (TIGR01451 family)